MYLAAVFARTPCSVKLHPAMLLHWLFLWLGRLGTPLPPVQTLLQPGHQVQHSQRGDKNYHVSHFIPPYLFPNCVPADSNLFNMLNHNYSAMGRTFYVLFE